MPNPNANSATLSGGGSTAVTGLAPPTPRVTAADLYPLRMQNLSDIEGKSTIGSYQFPADRGKYYMTLGFHKYERSMSDLMSIAKLDITDTITLPIPQQMVDTHNVNYAQEELGAVAGAATETVGNVGSALTGPGSVMTNLSQGTANMIAAGGNQFLQGLDAFFGSNISGIAKALTGLAPNQFLTVLLKGPQYKRHSFSWKMSPRNEIESESIRAIINLLNNSMAPGKSPLGGFFTFPKVVTISFMPNSNVLYRFKPCVIENLTVNYAPSGAPAFYRKTEAPDSIELKLDFMELEFWLSGDFTGTAINTSSLSRLTNTDRR